MDGGELAEEFLRRRTLLVSLFLGNEWATIRKRDGRINVQFSKKPCQPLLVQLRGTLVWNGKSWSVECRTTLRYPLEQLVKMLLDRSWRIGNAQA